MIKTPNYNLNKPTYDDFGDIADLNANADIIDAALFDKVSKETGKGLSEANFTATEKSNLASMVSDITNLQNGKQTKITASGILKGNGTGGVTGSTQIPSTDVSGLGNAATKNLGTAAGTVSEGNHNHNGVYATLTDGKVTPSLLGVSTVSVTSGKTSVLTDANTLQVVNSTSAITITIPTHASVAYPLGTAIDVMRYNTGAANIAVSSGVTVNGVTTTLTVVNRYGVISFVQIEIDKWIAVGDK